MKQDMQSHIQHEEKYVEFLRKRLASKSYLANATPEEVAKTRRDYDKAKFKLKMLKESL